MDSGRLETFLKQMVTKHLQNTFTGYAAGGIVPVYFESGFIPRGTDTVVYNAVKNNVSVGSTTITINVK